MEQSESTEVRSTKQITTVVVRHLTDEEWLFSPAVAIQSDTGVVYVKPGQIMDLVKALVACMEEAVCG